MNLNSIAPNAHYDLLHGEPKKLESDKDGSTLYRLNIEAENDQETNEPCGFGCYEIRTYQKPTKENIKHTVVRSLISLEEELDLINAYNSSKAGVVKNNDAVNAYKEHLQFLADLDAQVEADLAE